ncbi:MAG: DUF1189 family protein [Alphaproteobacteria bacterium]|nr:DUF1189 family protein [Alphaproteobacteria bacterium]
MCQPIKSLPQTFFSRSFYAGLITQGKGIGLGFILLLVLFNYAAPVLLKAPALPDVKQRIEDFFNRLPGMTIKGGKLSMDKPSPYTVDFNFGDKSSFTILFDTAYQESGIAKLEEDMESKNTDILVTSDFAAVRKNRQGANVEIHSFGKFAKQPINVDHGQWANIGKKAAQYFPFLFVIAVIPVFLAVFFLTFVKSLIVKFFALFFTIKPDLPAAMRLAAAAAMPASLINLLLVVLAAVLQQPIQRLPGFSGFLIWLAFAIYGLWSVNSAAKNTN